MEKTILALSFLLLHMEAAQTPSRWTPELAMEIQTVGSVVPSPDGRLAAWTQTRAVMEAEKSEMISQIYLGRTDGSRPMQLTRGEKSATAPSFSRDGSYVYFQSARSGKQNLWRISVGGGEAEMLTDWKGSIGAYTVSPDGKWIAFAGVPDDPEEEKAKKEKRDFRVVDENPKNHGLWVIAAEPGVSGTKSPRKLFANAYHITDLDWAPDSRKIAFEHQPTPNADEWRLTDISEVDVESGTVRPLAVTEAAERTPLYSPDGRYLAYTVSSEPVRWGGDARVVLLPRQDGQLRVLPASYDERPLFAGWSGDSSMIYFAENKQTRTALYAMPVDGVPKLVYEPKQGVAGLGVRLNAKATHAGFTCESSLEPPEACVLQLSATSPVRVSRANTDKVLPPIGETKLVRWKAKDGLDIEGLVTYPVGFESGKKYPLILNIHGGPMGVFNENYPGRPGLYPLAAFASKGYAVLRCNIRGSGGYGKQFRFANYNDWGGKDFDDLMAGVDHVIEMGVADPDRLAVMGWSYGGFMTSWVIGHTRRFKAAAIGAPVTNLWSFTGTSDIPGFLPDFFAGEPWDSFEAYRKHSPMSYVKGITTPALILHGEGDVRVPISQGYEFYNALKRQGIPAKMVVYPREPHGPQEPKFMLDILRRHLDWVEKYVR